MIKYIDIHSANEITFDPQEYIITSKGRDHADQMQVTLASLYVDAKEEIPLNAPPPRGNPVQINCFVVSDHAGDRITHRSHTGILMYLNKAPIS